MFTVQGNVDQVCRHLLAVIATHLDEEVKACDYLVLRASIYVGIISKSSAVCQIKSVSFDICRSLGILFFH